MPFQRPKSFSIGDRGPGGNGDWMAVGDADWDIAPTERFLFYEISLSDF
jgi:hypothetical protein